MNYKMLRAFTHALVGHGRRPYVPTRGVMLRRDAQMATSRTNVLDSLRTTGVALAHARLATACGGERYARTYSTTADSSNATASGGRKDEKQQGTGKKKQQGETGEGQWLLKERLAEQALHHVASLGWTQGALEKAADEMDLSPAVVDMFPRGGIELVEYFTRQCNKALAKSLKAGERKRKADDTDRAGDPDETESPAAEDKMDPYGEEMREMQREKIAQAIQKRIMMVEPFRARWPEAIALQALPQNAPTALRQAAELADELCKYADSLAEDPANYGMRIEDWYFRRATVGAIVQSVQLAWLSDSSPDYERTWTLLRRMLHTASQFDATLAETVQKFRLPAQASLQTIQSMLRSLRDSF